MCYVSAVSTSYLLPVYSDNTTCVEHIPYLPYMSMMPCIPYLSYLSYISYIPYIWNVITTPTIHTIAYIQYQPLMPYIPYIPNIPYFPNMSYQTDHTHHTYPPYHTTPPPHHRGGGGQCHTPTTPQGGEGEDLIWDQYMGPIPYGGGEGGGGRAWCIYIHPLSSLELHFHDIFHEIKFSAVLFLGWCPWLGSQTPRDTTAAQWEWPAKSPCVQPWRARSWERRRWPMWPRRFRNPQSPWAQMMLLGLPPWFLGNLLV